MDGQKTKNKIKNNAGYKGKGGGLKMPNLKLYYEAVVLSLITDWINLTEERVLNIEGYGLLYGWHAYLFYDKKVDKIFKNNIIRNALLRVWRKYQYKLDGETSGLAP